jgi:hypothetical protein
MYHRLDMKTSLSGITVAKLELPQFKVEMFCLCGLSEVSLGKLETPVNNLSSFQNLIPKRECSNLGIGRSYPENAAPLFR